jgi:hypothetical protein
VHSSYSLRHIEDPEPFTRKDSTGISRLFLGCTQPTAQTSQPTSRQILTRQVITNYTPTKCTIFFHFLFFNAYIVAQKALRLWCVRSVSCGALHHKKNLKKPTYVSALTRPSYKPQDSQSIHTAPLDLTTQTGPALLD